MFMLGGGNYLEMESLRWGMGRGAEALRDGSWLADDVDGCCAARCCDVGGVQIVAYLPAIPCLCCCSCWASRAQPTPKHIVYGATDLLAGEQFLHQLSTLGHKSGAAPVQTY